MNCNGCIANTMAQTAIGNHQAYYIVLRARDLRKELRDAGVCDMQPAALLLDTRRPVVVEATR